MSKTSKINLLFEFMKFNLLALIVLFSSTTTGQVIDISTNLNHGLKSLVVYNNHIYYTSFNQKKIFKIDLNGLNEPETICSFSENPTQLLLDQNFMYIATEQNDKIYRLNLDIRTQKPTAIANISGPMIKFDNYLYVGQYTESKIVKLDLNNNSITTIINGFKPNYFETYNNELYFTSNSTNQLYKFDPRQNNPNVIYLIQNMNYAAGITINDNYLFICESIANKITTYDLTDFSIVNSYSLSSGSWPNGIFYHNNEIYFTQTVAGKISKISLNTLGVSESTFTTERIKIYPNPTSSIVKIDSQNSFDTYEIYNLEQRLIEKKPLYNQQINVEHLSNGIYFIKLNNFYYRLIKN